MNEYRVIWQREGQAGKRRQFYQTRAGAERCAERQRTAAAEIDWVEGGIPPLIFGPVIEERTVGKWAGWAPVEGGG